MVTAAFKMLINFFPVFALFSEVSEISLHYNDCGKLRAVMDVDMISSVDHLVALFLHLEMSFHVRIELIKLLFHFVLSCDRSEIIGVGQHAYTFRKVPCV